MTEDPVLLTRAILLTAASALLAQPKFPQHSTGMPHVPPPPAVNNHITNLSGSIAGRPMPQPRGTRPIPVVGNFIGGWYPQPQFQPQPQSTPIVFVNQQNVAPAPSPILVVNPDYKPEKVEPVLREYSNISNPYENFKPNAPKVYLLTLKDGTLRQAVAFWTEDANLLYVQPDHKQDSLPLANLDRESTKRFNAERGLDIKLPD
jgi:hypothetical protein